MDEGTWQALDSLARRKAEADQQQEPLTLEEFTVRFIEGDIRT